MTTPLSYEKDMKEMDEQENASGAGSTSQFSGSVPHFDNAHDLLVYYGYDKGTVLERIDELCAGLIDASEEIGRLRKQLKEQNKETSLT